MSFIFLLGLPQTAFLVVNKQKRFLLYSTFCVDTIRLPTFQRALPRNSVQTLRAKSISEAPSHWHVGNIQNTVQSMQNLEKTRRMAPFLPHTPFDISL
jgi:hypothetical protein